MKLISFYCDVDGVSFYTDHSIRLRQQCERLGIESLILPENFGTSWIDNVRAKPAFLLKIMNQINEDFMWLDVDCNVHKKIDFNLDVDWMSDIRTDNNPHDYVHVIKNNERTKNFMLKWINEINEQKRGSHTAFIKIYKDLEFRKIPSGYVSLGLSDLESKKKYFKNGK
jgi:hypothetical protein